MSGYMISPSLLSPYPHGNTGQLTVGTTVKNLKTATYDQDLTIWRTKCNAVILKADDDNSGNIYIGFSKDVSSSNGFKLIASQAVALAIADLSMIYVIADAPNQKLHILALRQ